MEHEGITVRVTPDGECGLSSVLYMNVEWDLRTEPPSRWDYLSEAQIKALDQNIYEKILAVVAQTRSTFDI